MNVATAGLFGLMLTGCKDFFEIEPRDFVAEDNFWNEKADIDQMVMGCYTAMQSDEFIRRCIVWGDLRADNIFPNSTMNTNDDLYHALREDLLYTNVYTNWSKFYHVINKCNVIIDKAPQVSAVDPAYNESAVKATIAECTALRSLCYFYLIRAFEEVPFTRKAVSEESDVTSDPASSFDYVLGQIIADLEAVKNDAIVHYASSGSDDYLQRYNSNCNRITRTAINAMLTEMYLWKGDYDNAIACGDAVLAQMRSDYNDAQASNRLSSAYTLRMQSAPFGQTAPLYINSMASPENSAEAIFGQGNSFESILELSYNSSSKDDNTVVKSTALASLYGAPDNAGKVIGSLVVNSSVVKEIGPSSPSFNRFQNRYDTRYYTTFQPSEDYSAGSIRKFITSKYNLTASSEANVEFTSNTDRNFTVGANPNRNWIFYRLTDVMLLEAEALALKATDDTSAENIALIQKGFDLVYLVNSRAMINDAGKLTTTNAAASSHVALEKLVREERNRELMFEGKRWFDLLRYARRDGKPDVIKETVPIKVSVSGGQQSFSSMDALYWPYNKSELDANTNLKQKSIYASGSTESYQAN